MVNWFLCKNEKGGSRLQMYIRRCVQSPLMMMTTFFCLLVFFLIVAHLTAAPPLFHSVWIMENTVESFCLCHPKSCGLLPLLCYSFCTYILSLDKNCQNAAHPSYFTTLHDGCCCTFAWTIGLVLRDILQFVNVLDDSRQVMVKNCAHEILSTFIFPLYIRRQCNATYKSVGV